MISSKRPPKRPLFACNRELFPALGCTFAGYQNTTKVVRKNSKKPQKNRHLLRTLRKEKWSGRLDLNQRSLDPQSSALSGLGHAPTEKQISNGIEEVEHGSNLFLDFVD